MRSIEDGGRRALRLDRPAAVLFRRGSEPWLAEIPIGRGAIVVAPEAEFVLNGRIARADHAAILEELLAAGRRPVGFAEYARGIARAAHIGAVLARFRLGPALAWAAFLFALLLWRAAAEGRAAGRAARAPRREPAESIIGAARLFERALPDEALIAEGLSALRRELASGAGLSGKALDEALARLLAEAGWTDRDGRGPIAAAIRHLGPCFRRIDGESLERWRTGRRA